MQGMIKNIISEAAHFSSYVLSQIDPNSLRISLKDHSAICNAPVIKPPKDICKPYFKPNCLHLILAQSMRYN